MAIQYSSTTIGTITLEQTKKTGEKKKYKIQIRSGNCLAIFIYVYKQEDPEDPKLPYVHQLMGFFCDEKHLKNCHQAEKEKGIFKTLFIGTIKDVKLNLYYKDCYTLLKYMTLEGLQVKCFYKEPKKNTK